MNISRLNASYFQKELPSGRTKPCIFFCENENGEKNGDYVVKLRTGIESGASGLAAELIASQLAILLDIPTPEPAIINIDPLLGEGIMDTSLSNKIRKNAGLNFGSRVITGGFATWPTGKTAPSTLRPLVAEIFAFDALIQNPDRRVGKPNILWKNDELYIIDHEMSLMFELLISQPENPWQITNLRFLKDHLFYSSLKKQSIDINRFAGALELLNDNIIEDITGVPEEWRTDNLAMIKNHIRGIVEHIDDFVGEVGRILQ